MNAIKRQRSNIALTILFLLGVYSFVSDDDYHKTFDFYAPVKYNCDMLIGGWHPDVPQNVINECRKKGKYDSQTH